MHDVGDYDPLFLPEQFVWAGGLPGTVKGHCYVAPGPFTYLVQYPDSTREWVTEDDVTVRFLH